MGPKRKPAARKRKQLPLWLFALLLVALAGVVIVRLKLGPHRSHRRPPRKTGVSGKQTAGKTPSGERSPYANEKTPESARHNNTPGEGPATVSIVIDDVGYRMDLVEEAVEKLPRSVTFAIIPFLPYSEQSDDYLHAHGFPVILHAPMEPENNGRWKHTPGELMVGMPRAEVDKILAEDFKAVPHAEGANNHMGSMATSDPVLMRDVMAFLKARDFYFLDSRTTAQTVAYDTAQDMGIRSAYRTVFLDDVDEENAIIKQLDSLVTRAEREGPLVAIGHLRPRTIEVLSRKIPDWTAKGVRFIPLREVVH
jgi:hypothetical protein